MDDLEQQLRQKVKEVDAAQKALDALRDEEQALREAVKGSKKRKGLISAYLMRWDDPRMSEPLWLLGGQTAWGETALMGHCPMEWMSLEQRKIVADDLGEENFYVLQIAFNPTECREVTIYYDKPVGFNMKRLVEEIPLTTRDVFTYDRGYAWDFVAEWEQEAQP